MQKKPPLGVLILGRINCFIFGLGFLFISLIVYFNINPQSFAQVTEAFKASGLNLEITQEQFKLAILINAAVCAVFFISGSGILRRREWARKMTIYFSLAVVILTFIATIAQPAFIAQAILQVAYPGVLIFYFTNKEVEKYFRLKHKED